MTATTRLVLAALPALALTSAALASPAPPTADMAYTGKGKGSSVKIIFDGKAFNAFSGQLKHTVSNAASPSTAINGPRLTYCVDLSQHVESAVKPYQIVDIVARMADISTTHAATRGSAIAGLYNTFGSTAIGTTSATSNDFATAFQLAVWEIAYDFTGVASSINLTAGTASFKKTDGSALSSGVVNQFNTIIAAINNGPIAAGLVALRSTSYQDQLVYVPGTLIPSAGSAAMAALGGLLIARRRRAR